MLPQKAQITKLLSITVLLFFATTFTQADEYKNGFDISNATIPQDEILGGGPGKDGIPALSYPKFIPATRAIHLQNDDRVIGVKFNGIAKAYPLNILNWHEIVNDSIGDMQYVVTFCPLCGTGMVFLAEAQDMHLEFGVSGLLYNSDVLLYDRQSESLWSQILSKSVSGKMVDTKLTLLPSKHTTWSDWKQNNPDTLVLSRKTGYFRNYDRNPYSGYGNSTQLFFPAPSDSKDAKAFHPKETILGININGMQKAYPFSELDKTGSIINDNVGGTEFIIQWNKDAQSASVSNMTGIEIPSVQGFYFAWLAFYPQTTIYYFLD